MLQALDRQSKNGAFSRADIPNTSSLQIPCTAMALWLARSTWFLFVPTFRYQKKTPQSLLAICKSNPIYPKQNHGTPFCQLWPLALCSTIHHLYDTMHKSTFHATLLCAIKVVHASSFLSISGKRFQSGRQQGLPTCPDITHDLSQHDTVPQEGARHNKMHKTRRCTKLGNPSGPQVLISFWRVLVSLVSRASHIVAQPLDYMP